MKRIALLIGVVMLVGGSIAYRYYLKIWGPNVADHQDQFTLTIPKDASFGQVLDSLHQNRILVDTSSFVWLSKKMKYGFGIRPKSGRYIIPKSWSNRQLISMLRRGDQSQVKITIRPVQDLEDIAGMVGKKLEPDSLALIRVLRPKSSSVIDSLSSIIIPNTYKFFWSTTAQEFIQRMVRESETFWSSNHRDALAKKLGMSRLEVYTLASIVQRETNYEPEKKRIAGVYLNRLDRGIALQADPTIIFAMDKPNIRRVLTKYLQVDSPYNTYKYPGLPPGPIGLASISSIDAVLHAEDHEYIFFCARPDNTGQHAFAETLRQHNRHARKFQQWLDTRGIKK